jgi:hypothetical protein
VAADLKTRMLERLIDGGTWVSREALAEGLSTSPLAQEDALADLVIEGLAEFRQGSGYRLAGSAVQRRAVLMLRKQGTRRSVFAHESKGQYRVGVAELQKLGQTEALSLVMYEMVLPMPEPGPDALGQHLRQVQGVVDFSMRGVS